MPLPAASLIIACLAWSSRRLPRKLRRAGHKGVMCGCGMLDPPVQHRRPRSLPTRRTMERRQHLRIDGNVRKGRVCVLCERRVQEVLRTKEEGKVFANVSAGADTKAETQSWFELWAAYSSKSSLELPLSPAARAAPPLGPRSFHRRLRARERSRVLRRVNGR